MEAKYKVQVTSRSNYNNILLAFRGIAESIALNQFDGLRGYRLDYVRIEGHKTRHNDSEAYTFNAQLRIPKTVKMQSNPHNNPLTVTYIQRRKASGTIFFLWVNLMSELPEKARKALRPALHEVGWNLTDQLRQEFKPK